MLQILYRPIPLNPTDLAPSAIIRQNRENQCLSVRKLAKLSVLSPTFISGLERGSIVPSATAAHRIFDALEMSTDDRKRCAQPWSLNVRQTVREWDAAVYDHP